MEMPITHIGLDVHKGTMATVLPEAGKRGEVREHGCIANCIQLMVVSTP